MIVLDTHAWLWWVAEPGKLSSTAAAAIDGAERLGICSISCWEVAMLSERGRIQLDRAVARWVEQALTHPRVVSLPLTPAIAVRAGSLSDVFPGDPADRIIYATAIENGADLLSRDTAIGRFDPRRTIPA